MDRLILKKRWKRRWKWEIKAQIHKEYLIGKRRGKTSKEFKLFVKNFLKRNK